MLDLFPLELREPVWYVLAGFILGFAVSTLWEWLHFRRYRVENSPRIVTRLASNDSPIAPSTPILQESAEFEPAARTRAYRSPTVFLSGERTQPASEGVAFRTEPAKVAPEVAVINTDPQSTVPTTQTIERVTTTAIGPLLTPSQPAHSAPISAQQAAVSTEIVGGR